MLGYLGSILLALCAFPQMIKSIRDGHSDGISWGFLLMWSLGEVFTLSYVISDLNSDLPLLLNYSLNLIFLSVIIRYKIIGGKDVKQKASRKDNGRTSKT